MALNKPVVVECVHHWVIEAANGSKSSGTCSKCNKSKTFSNSLDRDPFWIHHRRDQDNA